VTRERVLAIDNGRIAPVRRMNGAEPRSPSPALLLSLSLSLSVSLSRSLARSLGEVVTHPVAGPFRALKALRSFLKTRPASRT